MKIRLSEWIDERGQETDMPMSLDQLALKRVHLLALEKAGFKHEPVPQRRVGKRRLIALVAALAALMLFATALAATDLGVQIADLFRDYSGAKSALETLGLYGSATGQAVICNGITLRIEAAYSDAGENLLAVSFEDALGRLGKGMGFVPELQCSDVRVLDISWYTPAKASDGTMHAPLICHSNVPLGGKDVKLSIKGIVPDSTSTEQQPTGITLGEALERELPFTVPGVPEVQLIDIHIEDSGLIVSLEHLEEGQFIFNGVSLRRADGSILTYDAMGASYETIGDQEVVRPENGFRQVVDAEAFKDCELLVSYTREAPPIEGEWTLTFQMPREADGSATDVPIHKTVQLPGSDYEIETARLFPSCVVLDYSGTDTQMPEPEVPEGTHWLFDTEFRAIPVFRLLDEDGQQIGIDLGRYDGQTGNTFRYKAMMQCLVEQQESIVLEVRNALDQEVLLTQKLK